MSRCYAQVMDVRGRVKRCPSEASETRAGVPVCQAHVEPVKEKK